MLITDKYLVFFLMICRTEVETGEKKHVRALAAQNGLSLDTLSSQILQLRLQYHHATEIQQLKRFPASNYFNLSYLPEGVRLRGHKYYANLWPILSYLRHVICFGVILCVQFFQWNRFIRIYNIQCILVYYMEVCILYIHMEYEHGPKRFQRKSFFLPGWGVTCSHRLAITHTGRWLEKGKIRTG